MRVASWTPLLALAASAGLSTAPAVAQDQAIVAHSISVAQDGSSLELELADGRRITIELTDGTVRINGERAGSYATGSGVESSWSNLLSQLGSLSTDELVAALDDWQGNELEELKAVEQELSAALALEANLGNLDAVVASAVAIGQAASVTAARDLALSLSAATQATATQQDLIIDLNRLTGDRSVIARVGDLRRAYGDDFGEIGIEVQNGRVHIGDLTVRRGQILEGNLAVLSGDVSVYGTINGNLAALNGDVILHGSARIEGDVVALNGRVTRGGGHVTGRVRSMNSLALRPRSSRVAPSAPSVFERRSTNQTLSVDAVGQNIATLFGFFIALASIGFGLNFFMPRQLEVVSETVSDSFGRSFFAGLFAQPLLLPLSVMLIAGLAITIVGIPVAVLVALALPVAVVGAAVTGYLAAAKAVGQSYLSRKIARGQSLVVTPYRSTLYGVGGLLAVWMPAVALGWIPLVGQLLLALAFISTWVMATAGVGAAILSRAGLRATFAGSEDRPALTDEHYWPMDASNYTPARRGRSRK